MNSYIHFVGKGYYGIEGFMKEAKELGVSRRVPLKLLKNLKWGDRIYLAQGDLPKKNRNTEVQNTTVFGYFDVTTIAVPESAFASLDATLELAAGMADKGRVVYRGCGKYQLGMSFLTPNSIKDIYEILETEKEMSDVFSLLQGDFHELIFHLRLRDIHWQQGLRRIDDEELWCQVSDIIAHPEFDYSLHWPLITGDLKPDCGIGVAELNLGEVQEVKNYRLRKPDQSKKQ